ncbi:MAG: helix-turn-helix domain-containing protein [Acidimicrobiales bacterium]
MSVAVETFGSSLRWWRTTRRFSQLQLANEAEVSSRHISFLETGRAQPSREMVIHLATVLDLSLRDRNQLLHGAGFAPAYSHNDMDSPDLDDVRQVIVELLAAHSPNPAVVVDRRGDVMEANAAAFHLIGATIVADSQALLPTININRLSLHPDGVKARSADWPNVAGNLLQRLEREVAHRPADQELGELLAEMLTYPDVAELRRTTMLPTGADLLVPLELETFDGQRLRLLSTVATIGAPYDVTLDELRLETFFAVDDATRAVLASWDED